MKKAIALGFVLLLVLNLTSCGAAKATKEKRYEAQFLVLFDTETKIIGYADNKKDFTKFADSIYHNLKVYHRLYDIYHTYKGMNNLKTINDNAGIRPVKVDKRIIDLLTFAKSEYVTSRGTMNIAMGSVLTIWHKYREAGIANPDQAQLPPQKALTAASKHMNINDLIINEKDSTVYLKDKKMSLDVGSVGKGYATEQVCRIAEENGYTSGLVSVGGNVRAIGENDVTGKPWNVGVQNPNIDSKKQDLVLIALNGGSLVTSGNYQRYYMVNGKRYCHLIDPHTLYPANHFASVTILCKNSGVADALTTALYIMPFKEGLKFIESKPGLDAMWVYNDGAIKYSPHFKDHIEK